MTGLLLGVWYDEINWLLFFILLIPAPLQTKKDTTPTNKINDFLTTYHYRLE